ncbi:MAG: putative metalloprotease CJM1_0395 family protein [Emcibacteraceae bacterium]
MISILSTPLPSFQSANAGGEKPPAAEINSAPFNIGKSSELNEEGQAEVERLKKVDQEVRAHEAAHKNAGGQFAGSASFSYSVGPDGKRYAVGGEVSIDVAPIEGDPEATVAKLDVVIAAALAPAKPSAQDRKVAAAAVAARNKARAELLDKKREETGNADQINPSFDVNNFGKTSALTVRKAYENGNGLTENSQKSGNNFSLIS